MDNRPKYKLSLGMAEGEELFSALVRDLSAGEDFHVPFGDLVQTYPTMYRLVNRALCTGDPGVISELVSNASLPAFARSWVNDVISLLSLKGRELRQLRTRPADVCRLKEKVESIRKLRQFLGLYSRLTSTGEDWSLKCREALSAFKDRVTQDVQLAEDNLFSLVGEAFFKNLDLQRKLEEGATIPRHGPGAVSEGLKAWRKQEAVYRDRGVAFTRMPWLHYGYFRFPMNLGPWPTDDQTVPAWVKAHPYECELEVRTLTSKVKCVPKDFRGPRIIAEAPTILQYLMLGIDDQLKNFLKRSPLRSAVHPHTQDYNRDAALVGSKKQCNVTIDLKDASDTVRCAHVDQMLKFRKDLRDTLYALRSDACELPNGERVVPTTFSLMGDGTTFRIETIVFSLEAITAIIDQAQTSKEEWIQPFCHKGALTRVSGSLIRQAALRSHLLVYGDDIIVDYRYAHAVINRLKRRQFLVSDDKTCFRSPFRESCGQDAFLGYDVSVLRPRHLPGSSEQSLSGHVEAINDFAARGYTAAAVCLRRMLARRGYVVPIEPSDQNTAGLIHSDILYRYATSAAQVRKFPEEKRYWDGWQVKVPRDVSIPAMEHVDANSAEGRTRPLTLDFDHVLYWRSLSPHSEELEEGYLDGLTIRFCWSTGQGLRPYNLDRAVENMLISR